jgi:hypothetical protein
MKRWSGPCGDVGRSAETTGPPIYSLIGLQVTGSSEIPCRVSNDLPLKGAIPSVNPANNGEAFPRERKVIPWEVGSDELLDPVTTEAKAEMAFLPCQGQIYERHKTPALFDSSPPLIVLETYKGG